MSLRARVRTHRTVLQSIVALPALLTILFVGSPRSGFAQNPPLNIFKNYIVTGDYVAAGWVEQSSANGLATGTISIPDSQQARYTGVPSPSVPTGADIVAAYLYWATVEGNQSSFVGQQAHFNGYKIIGTILGNPFAPTSWSSGGCTGGSNVGSKTMRFYRADVRPYLPTDLSSTSPTFGALVANGSITVQIADSGSNGNTQPNALGATLVVIYRVLSPQVPLNAIVLYDGSYAPSNSQPNMTQVLTGFYQPGIPTGMLSPNAKLTHIVANGQMNKGETVYFGSNPRALNKLNSLYTSTLGATAPPFPGIYGAWDNPTWSVGNYISAAVPEFDTQEITSVSPTNTNGGCVNWGAVVLSTTVQDSDNDGLLDVWENNQGYTDAVTQQQVSLPGANPNTKDLFVEVDYLTSRDALGNVLHSHLPKQQALDAVGQAFAAQGVNVHFDLPFGIYPNDQYVISTGAGGNEIPESAVQCTDGALLCAFPNQASISWKGGFESVQNDPKLGNFQAGRLQSYHYALFGHSMGEPRSYWGALAAALVSADPGDLASSTPQLVSIVNVGSTATVTIKSPSLIGGIPPQNPPLVLKPGDCNVASPPVACLDTNIDRVNISGSLAAPFVAGTNTQPPAPLSGTYKFGNVSAPTLDNLGMITTTFQITTSGVADGTYVFSCPAAPTNPPCVADPQLGVSYMGPTSSSGHGDFGGGGDLEVTFGQWGADNAPGCQADPSVQLVDSQVYCDDQVGTLKAQTGTLMHELGHTLTLTHGGTYFQGSSVPTYELNCKPNFISAMNYLFQIRGFGDGGFDYSGQTLPPLNEKNALNNGILPLSESTGLGLDIESSQPAAHLTRWYSGPNATDLKLQDQAIAHCDGSPMAMGEPAAYRVNAQVAPGGTNSAPLDWNNDLITPDAILGAGIDLNHNGIIGDAPFSGYDDWANVDLQQINGRSSGFGFSEGGGLNRVGGGLNRVGGGVDGDGGGLNRVGGGLNRVGGGLNRVGGGIEEDTETANSTADAPSGLTCTQPLTTPGGTVIPGCTNSSGSLVEKAKSVPLTWTSPDFGQIRSYTVWRAIGSFTTSQQILANIGKFSAIGTVNGTPPSPSFIDNVNLKSSTTYTYFVTDSNKFTAKSGPSTTLVVTVKF